MRCALLLLLAVATAHADDLTGFVASGTGALSGRVTDAKGNGVANAPVHVATARGERIVTTDRSGAYRTQLDGETMIFIRDLPGAKIGGETATTVSNGSDGEAIAVQATNPPAVMPKPKSSVTDIPDYSDAAIDKNAWTRAWLLLDVDEAGYVRKLKFLKRPGYDLDGTAMKAAFALRFEAARDVANKPVRAMILWSYEWPSYYWMQELHVAIGSVPPQVLMMPCQKSGEHRAERRDCAGPDLAHGLAESWIAPRRAK